MLTRGPHATVLLAAFCLKEIRIARTAPGLHQFSGFVEYQHRWRGHTAAVNLPIRPRKSKHADRIALRVLAGDPFHSTIGGADRTGTVVNPDVIVLIDGNSADVANHPVVRQRLRPRRIEYKARRDSLVLSGHR